MEENTNSSESGIKLEDKPVASEKIPESTSENVSSGYDESPEAREHTRSRMAVLFVLGFFCILFLCFVYAVITGAKLSELKDTLVALIGALSGTLGFIVGYYYKSVQEQ